MSVTFEDSFFTWSTNGAYAFMMAVREKFGVGGCGDEVADGAKDGSRTLLGVMLMRGISSSTSSKSLSSKDPCNRIMSFIKLIFFLHLHSWTSRTWTWEHCSSSLCRATHFEFEDLKMKKLLLPLYSVSCDTILYKFYSFCAWFCDGRRWKETLYTYLSLLNLDMNW